jgi:pyridoxine 5-phosphate synthase
MAATDEMVAIALEVKPDYVTLVPEKREEVTTEGGLDIAGQASRMAKIVETLQTAGIPVSLFIDPDADQIKASADSGAKFIELHTGRYAEARKPHEQAPELAALGKGCELAIELGLRVNAGHGLTYWNVYPVAQLPGMEELNIGHSIISRAALVGLDRAVREMKQAMRGL